MGDSGKMDEKKCNKNREKKPAKSLGPRLMHRKINYGNENPMKATEMEWEVCEEDRERKNWVNKQRHIYSMCCVFSFKSIVAYDFNALTLIPVPSVKFYYEKWMGWKDDDKTGSGHWEFEWKRAKGKQFDLHNLKYKVQNR